MSASFDARRSYIWSDLILWGLRKSLHDLGFVEILPAILSSRFEPGARHGIAVLGHRALPEITDNPDAENRNRQVRVGGHRAYYLPVSHAVEKQFSLEHMERVYTLAPCVRLLMSGEHDSGRHLYTFFQVEIEWRTESIDDVFTTAEKILATTAREVLASLPAEWRDDETPRHRLASLTAATYPRLTFAESVARVRRDAPAGNSVNPHSPDDLTHDEETALAESFETPFWVYDYPEGVRDSLYQRNAAGRYDTYDLMLPFGFGELLTGGLRPESGAEIVRQSEALGREFHEDYANWKDRAGVQTAGFGIGLERLIRFCSGATSILDVRRYHDSGPNAGIEDEPR